MLKSIPRPPPRNLLLNSDLELNFFNIFLAKQFFLFSSFKL